MDLKNPVTVAIIIVIGMIVQLIDGMLGMGYGVTSSSFLITAGLAPAVVSASVHTAEMGTTFVSGVSHYKFGNIKRDIAFPLIWTGVLGGILGAYFLCNADPVLVKPLVAIILLAMGVRIFLRFAARRKVRFSGKDFRREHLMPLGFVGGAMDAFGGGGWGPVCTTTLVSTERKEPRYVVGSVNFAEFFVTVAITATFVWQLGLEKFLWWVTIPLVIGGVVAAPLAAWACKRVSPYTLGVFVGALLITTNARTIMTSLPEALEIDPWLKTQTEKDMFTLIIALWMISIILTVWMMRKQHRLEIVKAERQEALRALGKEDPGAGARKAEDAEPEENAGSNGSEPFADDMDRKPCCAEREEPASVPTAKVPGKARPRKGQGPAKR